MSFRPQPNEWTCGPFALKHALIALGRPSEGEELARIAGTNWWSGTDEIRLARAARSQNCDLPVIRHRRAERAKSELLIYLRQKTPVLLCVDNWGHWIVVLTYEKGQFVVIDSLLEPVLSVLTWPQLRRRWRYLDVDYDESDPPEIYEMFPVLPRFRVSMQANFTVARVRYLRRPENQKLSAHWNAYLEDLLAICRPPSALQSAPLSMAEFLRRHQKLLVDQVGYWHGEVSGDELVRQLGRFRFVAETYGLVIPESASKRALVDMACLLTMWAVAKHGLGEIYGESE